MDVQHGIMRHAHAHEHTNKHIVSTLVELRWKIWNVSRFWFGFARSFRFFSKYVSFHCCTSIFIFNKIECDYILAPHERKKERHETGFQNKLTWNRFVQMKIGLFARARLSFFLFLSNFFDNFRCSSHCKNYLFCFHFANCCFDLLFFSYSFEFFICLVHDRDVITMQSLVVALKNHSRDG